MNYIRITKENIDKEHVCCAMSGKQSVDKKEWMKRGFDDGKFVTHAIQSDKKFLELAAKQNKA